MKRFYFYCAVGQKDPERSTMKIDQKHLFIFFIRKEGELVPKGERVLDYFQKQGGQEDFFDDSDSSFD